MQVRNMVIVKVLKTLRNRFRYSLFQLQWVLGLGVVVGMDKIEIVCYRANKSDLWGILWQVDMGLLLDSQVEVKQCLSG